MFYLLNGMPKSCNTVVIKHVHLSQETHLWNSGRYVMAEPLQWNISVLCNSESKNNNKIDLWKCVLAN